MAEAIETRVRWMIRVDMPAVLAIESQSFPEPWTEEEFISLLRKRNMIGMVIEDHKYHILGYMIYGLEKDRLILENIAVRQDVRFCGLGRKMIEKLISKLMPDRRRQIKVMVADSNIHAHLFFRRLGFRCTKMIYRPFSGSSEDDGYVFTYSPFEEKVVQDELSRTRFTITGR